MNVTQSRPLAGLNVLVVEDEALIAVELALSLEDEGAIVLGPCASVRQALDVLGAKKPDVAVLDVRLGKDDVGPVAHELKRQRVPFVFQTGHGTDAMLANWPDAPVLRKPQPFERLVASIKKAINAA